jgi:5'-3' exonuclease|tara:strand:- start:488 stop:1240 length:753 start_codon:yes stop_codon:yes gene_type:complete
MERKMKTRTLLIDADIVLYKVASMVEVATDWGDGIWTLHSDLKEAIPSLNKCVESYLEKLDTDIAKMCLTGHNNFRKKVHSEYKANRLNKRKPLVLGALREYVEATYDCLCEDNLEADDLMGLYSQHVIPNNENIIVSIDKDMRTIPCKLCVDGEEILTISKDQADYYFAIQCLTGDSTDNYHGCPGVGPVKAKAILDKAEGSYWEAIVAAYKKAELTEKQALQQARLAYILHDAKDYNFKTKKVKQWTP